MEDKGKTPGGQANLEKVFDLLNIGISVHNIDGDIVEANEALGRLLSMPPEELIGKKCYQVFHLKEGFIGGCPMSKSMLSKKPENAEFLLPQLNRWVSFLTIPIVGEGDKVSRVIHVVRDITERRHMEKAHEDIKMLDKMKEELVTNVTHELRTPLQVVQTAFELISDDVTDADKKDLLDRGLENLDRLNALIGDIMKAVQLREKMLPSQEVVDINKPIHPLLVPVEVVERKPVDVGELIKKCTGGFSREAEKKEITIECQIDEDLPLILGDEKELDMAFSHLLSNAIKFNGKGGSVSLEVKSMGDKVMLNVTDTGVGIPKEKLPKIFDRFYQVDGSTTRRHEGTGLGLYLVKNIIERQGGSIWAESEEGVGTKFICVLPSME
jgi:PAS domain S-box-containing protein